MRAIPWLELILLPVALIASEAPAAGAPTPGLPTPAEVVARYDAALGGEAALRRHTSSTSRGHLEIPGKDGAIHLPFVYFASAPYLRLERVTLPGAKGDVLNGFDGTMAWSFDPRTGPQITSGDERESVKRDADFYYPLDELTWFQSMVDAGIEVYEGHRCYHLAGFTNWGRQNNQFYDVATGLLAGYEFESSSSGGPGLIHEIFTDYRKIDGVLVPMKTIVKARAKGASGWTVLQTIVHTSVTFNDVEPGVYAPPRPVLDLASRSTPGATP